MSESGRVDIIEEIFKKGSTRMLRIAYRYMNNWEDTSDCVQTAFLKVMRSIKTIKNPKQIISWFYRILINTCKDEICKRAYRMNYLKSFTGETAHGVHRERTGRFPHPEIAQMVGCSQTTIRVHLCCAKKELVKKWQKEVKNE